MFAVPGEIKPDHPQPPGRSMLRALETHPPRHHRQVRGGDHQPGPQLGVNPGIKQRQHRPQLFHCGLPGQTTAMSEVLAGERSGDLLEEVDVRDPDVTGAGGLSLRQQREQPVGIQPGRPRDTQNQPGDVLSEVSAVHPAHVLPRSIPPLPHGSREHLT